TAMRESQQLIRTPGHEPRGRLVAGLIWLRDGEPHLALPELERAISDKTTAAEALSAGANCFYLLGRYAEAIRVSQQALQRDPQDLDARRCLAAAFYDLGAAADAAEQLEQISAAAPGDSRPERLLGSIEMDNERFAEAVAHFRESLRRDAHQA